MVALTGSKMRGGRTVRHGGRQAEVDGQLRATPTPTHSLKRHVILVPTEGVEPTHSHEYQILSLARLPIPPRRQSDAQYKYRWSEVNKVLPCALKCDLKCVAQGVMR